MKQTLPTIPVIILSCAALPCHAQTTRPAELVAEAESALAAGEFDRAIHAYRAAEKALPGTPQIAFNEGVAWYRKGDFAKAADAFSRATTGADAALNARISYNLGNCAYATALSQQAQPQEAMQSLRSAITHYRDAIQANAGDVDARANMEAAHRLIRLLEEQQKQQQEQEQDQKKDDQQPQSRPESQPESQPSSQPSQNEQQKNERSQQQDQQNAQSGQQSQDKGSKEQKQSGKQGQEKESGEQDKQDKHDGKLESAQESKTDQKNTKQGQAVPATQRAMTPEEAERLLQMIRDRERARMLEWQRQQRARQEKVEKDW